MRGEAGVSVAQELRRRSTVAEQRLWRHLRNRRLGGYKFRRQHPVDGYILDFYCEGARLGIEVDGGGHTEADQARHDQRRDERLSGLGIRVVRFWNHEVMDHIEAVLSVILEALEGSRR